MAKLEALEQLFNPRINELRANELCAAFGTFPAEVVTTDLASLHRLGSLVRVIAEKHARTAAVGFSVDRVLAHVSAEYPRVELLQEIAEQGAMIFLPESFVPTSVPPEPRSNLVGRRRRPCSWR